MNCVSPWYNANDWLGIKNQLQTYTCIIIINTYIQYVYMYHNRKFTYLPFQITLRQAKDLSPATQWQDGFQIQWTTVDVHKEEKDYLR